MSANPDFASILAGFSATQNEMIMQMETAFNGELKKANQEKDEFIEKEKVKLMDQINVLQQRLEESEKNNKNYEAALGESQESVRRLENQIDTLNCVLTAKTEAQMAVNEKNQQLEHELQYSEYLLNEMGVANDQIYEDLSKSVEEIQELEIQLHQAVYESAEKDSELKLKDDKIQDLQKIQVPTDRQLAKKNEKKELMFALGKTLKECQESVKQKVEENKKLQEQLENAKKLYSDQAAQKWTPQLKYLNESVKSLTVEKCELKQKLALSESTRMKKESEDNEFYRRYRKLLESDNSKSLEIARMREEMMEREKKQEEDNMKANRLLNTVAVMQMGIKNLKSQLAVKNAALVVLTTAPPTLKRAASVANGTGNAEVVEPKRSKTAELSSAGTSSTASSTATPTTPTPKKGRGRPKLDDSVKKAREANKYGKRGRPTKEMKAAHLAKLEAAEKLNKRDAVAAEEDEEDEEEEEE